MLEFNFSLPDAAIDSDELFDLIIIGGGPAGLTVGLYAARYKLKTLMIEKAAVAGGQLALTEWVENYPGFPEPVLGKKLAKDMEDQAKLFGMQLVHEEVVEVVLKGSQKSVRTKDNSYKTRSILISTGSSPRKIGVPGESEYSGKGISYCATCDGPFYPDKRVAVVGGGNTAFEEAIFLAKYASEVVIIHRREGFSADPVVIDRVLENPKIQLMTNTILEEIAFGESPRKLKLINTIDKNKSELEIDGLFIFIGSNPNSRLFEGQLELEDGYILTDGNHKSSVEGVWAAGDVEAKALRQVATAVGDGALAAHSIYHYLEHQGRA